MVIRLLSIHIENDTAQAIYGGIMTTLSFLFSLLIAIEHFYILVLEMFLGTSTRTSRAFSIPIEFLKDPRTIVMMKNQGLYNGFLASGILFTLFILSGPAQFQMLLFFLGCVIIAGIYGAFTVKPSIFFLQAVPAILAFIFVLLTGGIH